MNFSFTIHKDLLTASLLFKRNPKDGVRFTELRNRMWDKHREAYEIQNSSDYKFIFAIDYKKKLENILEKTKALLTDTEESTEYKDCYQETLRYRDWLENEWKSKKDEIEKHLKDILKTDLPPKDFEVLVIHPAVGGGSYLGSGKIFWGHSEDWDDYGLVYLIHEALHEYFEHSDLTHALIELIADNELRVRLNNDGEYFICSSEDVGHKFLRNLEVKLLPRWREYLKQNESAGDIFDLINELKNSKDDTENIVVKSIFKITPLEDSVLQGYKDRAIKELNEFFNQKWIYNTPKVFVVDDRKTINLLKEKETEDWVVGWSMGRIAVCILNPNNISKESSHNEATYNFEHLIKHELCHSFFQMVFGQCKFAWINEGVSVYVSGQLDKYSMPKEFNGFLDGKKIYQESGNAIKLIVDNFGKQTLFDFLKAQSKVEETENLNTIFEDIFKAKLNYSFFNELKNGLPQ